MVILNSTQCLFVSILFQIFKCVMKEEATQVEDASDKCLTKHECD